MQTYKNYICRSKGRSYIYMIVEFYFKKHHFWKGLGYILWDFCLTLVNGPNVINGYIKQRHIQISFSLWDWCDCSWDTTYGWFSQWNRNWEKSRVPRRGINMIGWKRILLASSGGLEGKLVLFCCSLQELFLIKAVKLSYVMLKLKEPDRPSHSRTGIESKQNDSNGLKEKIQIWG